MAQTLPSSSLAHSWAREAGAEIFGWGVLLGCCPHGHFRGLRPPSALPGPGSLQARVFHILSPFLSLSRGQWRPEESEDYETTISGLTPETTYSVTVAAYTTKGDGARSKPKIVTTTGAGE